MKLDKNYKVRVTPEQSREIHSLILLDGGEVSYGLKPQLQDEFLVIENEHGSVVIYYTDQDIFLSAEQQEIQADDLITLLTDLSKSAENPLQSVELTPEFEALADNSVNIQDMGTDILDTNANIKDTPKFKVGDLVYFPRLSNKLCVIGAGQEDDYVDEINGSKALAEMQSDLDFVYDQKTNSWLWDEKDCAPQLLHATPENYELLSKLYPHINFEKPPKELMGSDLARALIKKGWIGFNCLCGNSGDGDAITDTIVTGINNGGQFTTIDGRLFNNAIPMKGWRPLQAREVGL